MKESPTPTPSDDANDPLLAALRQRLGDYGAAPPPGAWAGIRQRLPVAPRPWWRRPRRLLPLLALLLGLVATTSTVRRWHELVHAFITSKTETEPLAPVTVNPTVPAVALKNAPKNPTHTTTPSAATSSSTKEPEMAVESQKFVALTPDEPDQHNNAENRRAKDTATHRLGVANPTPSLTGAKTNNLILNTPLIAISTAPLATSHSLATTARPLVEPDIAKQTKYLASEQVLAGSEHRPAAVVAASGAQGASRLPVASARRYSHKHLASSKELQAGRLANASHRYQVAAARLLHRSAPATVADLGALPESRLLLGIASHKRYSSTPPARYAARLHRLIAGTPQAPLATEPLALVPVGLLPPPALSLPAPLVGLPDSAQAAPARRHWSLLALVGPTLSYRTLGITTPPAATTTRPDFARLERPALGFGAQVQVRRVLSGRWALAVGLGYQEYATRLALQVNTDSTSMNVHQRDTYRLLTLPVQLSYALGVPRSRLAKALLVGTEAGWYQGGRSTEGSDCGCQQKTYTAPASPYRPWTLALSLGLDLRYRVGGPAGRWQWVVQPTGRYVLTPFIKPDMAGFTARQPFSLGLLTGLSWDIR